MFFTMGDFRLASGAKSSWKIELDCLSTGDLETLAKIASERLEPFGFVEGVPQGGLRFAEALKKYITPGSMYLLIAEDVVTTGGSMESYRNDRAMCRGVAIFARGVCPDWVTPLFVLTPARG